VTKGRPRKPAHLKVVAGTNRKDRENPSAPTGSALEKLPRPPDDLSKGEADAWRELSKIVEPLGVATAADLVAFRQMAVTLAVIEAAREVINVEGLTFDVFTENGMVVRKRPEVEILISYKKQLSVELSRFGLTPADRERVSVLKNDGKADPLSEFAVR
jgi:P27 family predicted phage terminase small subunit